MSNPKYYVITSSEDGLSIDEFDEAALRDAITPDKDGDTHFGPNPVFLDELPELDKGCFFNVDADEIDDTPMLIIRGKIVVPKAKQKVLQYELPDEDEDDE